MEKEKTLGRMSFDELWQIADTGRGQKALAAIDEIMRRQKAHNANRTGKPKQNSFDVPR